MTPMLLNELQLDALREVGGIGAAHAATALSELSGRRVDLSVPSISIMDVAEVPGVVGGPEAVAAALWSPLEGELSGGVLILAAYREALVFVDLLRGALTGSTKSLSAADEILLQRAGCALADAYVSAIALLSGARVNAMNATLAVDMAGALLECVVAEVDEHAHEAVLVKTSFSDEGHDVNAGVFFFPGPEGLTALLVRLGLA
jgi:chemotaxis protein CheC